MLTKEQALEFSKLILADQPEADVKFQFLSEHTDGGIYWSLLRCFIVGMDVQTVAGYLQKGQPKNKAEVDQWMLDELAARLRDRDHVYQALVDLQEKVSHHSVDHEDYENTLRDLNKAKLELKNMKQTVTAKDQLIRQLQDKLKNVPTVGTKDPDGEKKDIQENTQKEQKTRDTKQKLSLEAFKHDVLLNEAYSDEQKDYLLSLLEGGENYSDINALAEPSMSINDMRRLHDLMKRQQTPEKPLVDRIRERLQGMRE